MKRFIAFILIFILLTTLLSGCSQTEKSNDGKLNIVCTIFPQYDWVRQILGDKTDGVNLTFLLNNRVDLHNYQPSADDIIKISSCDLFIYVGGESDKWANDILKDTTNKNMCVINLLDTLGMAAKSEEVIEGMENVENDEDEADYDEHVWLSLKNAQTFCAVIADALSSLDKNNAAEYKNNLDLYIEKLVKLDSDYQTAVNAASVKTLLFGDRFPFRYLVDDYGLKYHAAFAGCSAETEASFNTIIFLANKADELNLKNIMVTESSNKKIAETIISNTSNKNQQILVMDAMQSVTSADVQKGTTYLSIMENNLNVLKEALK